MFVIDSLSAGGTERSITDLLMLFQSRNVEALVVALRQCGPEGFDDEVRGGGIELLFAPSGSALKKILWLSRLIKQRKPDLIHTMLAKADMVGRLASFNTVPVLCSLVNLPYNPEKFKEKCLPRRKVRLWQILDIITSRFLVTRFHAVSESVKDGAVRRLFVPGRKIAVVGRGRSEQALGEPSEERKAEARRVLGLGEDEIVLSNVGRCDYQKGQRYLLEAMKTLGPNGGRLHLLIAGKDGTASRELDALAAEPGFDKRVTFLGHRRDVQTILAASDVFVFPSLYEGMPGALIEAMALGLPIIASDIGPVREVVEEGKNALLFPIKSSGALGDAIERLAINPAMRESFGKRSREIFLERFRLPSSADGMVRLYQDVIEGAKALE